RRLAREVDAIGIQRTRGARLVALVARRHQVDRATVLSEPGGAELSDVLVDPALAHQLITTAIGLREVAELGRRPRGNRARVAGRRTDRVGGSLVTRARRHQRARGGGQAVELLDGVLVCVRKRIRPERLVEDVYMVV